MEIGAALKQQMLGVLIDALGKPASSGGQPPAPAPGALVNLVPGDLLTARVLAVRPDGNLTLQLMGQSAKGQMNGQLSGLAIEANLRGVPLPDAARQPGATLQLRVEAAGATPRLSFVALDIPQALSASTVTPITTAEATLQGKSAPVVLANPTAQIVSRAAAEAATRQGSAAPLYADLAALAARHATILPRPVIVLAQALLASRLDAEMPILAGDIKQAIARSGVMQEASLARGDPAILDAKALLMALREALRGAVTPAQLPSDAEPPRRDGAVVAQKAAMPLLATEVDPRTIAATLAMETDHAVERLKLHQIASLPDQRQAGLDPARPQQLNLEIPLAFGQHTAMAGFRIEREKRRNREASQAVDVWGVRFAIDADVLGAVHAHISLSGHKVSVSLWAENPATRGVFTSAMPMLEAALADNALDIGELRVFAGKPTEPARAMQGHFLDRSS